MGWLLLYLLFSAVYIDVDGTSVFASRMLKLGSREHDPGYMERLVDTLIASDFVGMRMASLSGLYYLNRNTALPVECSYALA